jgi:hypothetical protein
MQCGHGSPQGIQGSECWKRVLGMLNLSDL